MVCWFGFRGTSSPLTKMQQKTRFYGDEYQFNKTGSCVDTSNTVQNKASELVSHFQFVMLVWVTIGSLTRLLLILSIYFIYLSSYVPESPPLLARLLPKSSSSLRQSIAMWKTCWTGFPSPVSQIGVTKPESQLPSPPLLLAPPGSPPRPHRCCPPSVLVVLLLLPRPPQGPPLGWFRGEGSRPAPIHPTVVLLQEEGKRGRADLQLTNTSLSSSSLSLSTSSPSSSSSSSSSSLLQTIKVLLIFISCCIFILGKGNT